MRSVAQSGMRIVLSEGGDPRVAQAAIEANARQLARLTLLGQHDEVRAALAAAGNEQPPGIEIVDPTTSPDADRLAALFLELRGSKGVAPHAAVAATREAHVFAALSVRAGLADGTIGGARLPTADIVRTAIQIIGRAPGVALISSYFLMLLCSPHHPKTGAYLFADAGLVIDPDAQQMAQIAIASAASFKGLTGVEPRVAMLSFSTHGSGAHEQVSKVVKATGLVRTACPDLLIDGDLQFDAAFVPEIAAAKAKGSPLGGEANVFVFPNLDAGNIGYKIAQRMGGATAIGPILQGLARPANDLSRGCSAEDILHLIAITSMQAKSMREAEHEPA